MAPRTVALETINLAGRTLRQCGYLRKQVAVVVVKMEPEYLKRLRQVPPIARTNKETWSPP